MDPDANLEEQLRLVASILAIWDGADPDTGEIAPEKQNELEHDAYRLAELVEALDECITRHGGLPERWRRAT